MYNKALKAEFKWKTRSCSEKLTNLCTKAFDGNRLSWFRTHALIVREPDGLIERGLQGLRPGIISRRFGDEFVYYTPTLHMLGPSIPNAPDSHCMTPVRYGPSHL